MVCHHSHVYTCLALVGENKKGKKGQTENSFLQLSGLVQLRQRQCWLQHALPTGFWAFILFLFFCKQFHTEVFHAEWDQTGLKHLPWGRLAGFMSKPTALEAASHGFLACSLTQIYSPCIHTPPKSWSSPHLGSCSDNQASFIQRGLNTGTFFFFPVNSGTSLEENPRQGLKGPGRISGYENSSLVKIWTAKS